VVDRLEDGYRPESGKPLLQSLVFLGRLAFVILDVEVEVDGLEVREAPESPGHRAGRPHIERRDSRDYPPFQAWAEELPPDRFYAVLAIVCHEADLPESWHLSQHKLQLHNEVVIFLVGRTP
jgi:hypothetical protein